MAVPEAVDGALGRLAQERLQLGEGVLDRVEVGRVGREVEQARAGCLDQLSHPRPLVAGQVVHDHDVAGPQLGDEDPLDVGLEGVAVDRAVEDEGRHDPVLPQPGHEGGRLPVAVRDAGAQALASRRPPVASGHVGGGPGLVDEHQALGVEVELVLEPGLAPLQDVRAVLLGGVRRLFLRVILWRRQKRQSAATLT